MQNHRSYISYEGTGYFSKTVIDYLGRNQQLQPFYKHPVSVEGIQDAISARKAFPTNRKLLVEELQKQYTGIELSSRQEANLQSLLHENTFTVTTAHQPNIFTGPLYFIYKILHAVKLADELKLQLPQYNFVPVYYMGSEDADLDELGYLYLDGQKLTWNTQQTGAVGRMKVDKAFLPLIESIRGRVGVHPFGEELVELFRQAYTLGKTIQQATLELVNALFNSYGLLVVIPDNAALKASFNKVVAKELTEQFSHGIVAKTIEELSRHYKVQAGGRKINLFYLLENKREHIELENGQYIVRQLQKQWNKDAILQELAAHPERFSANVILRGVFQETILPNIAFIGGGGELAYWLELKNVFEAAGVPYPVLVLRNSFLILNQRQEEKIRELDFCMQCFFAHTTNLLNDLVKKRSTKQLDLTKEREAITALYNQLQAVSSSIDPTLQQHTEALQTRALKPLAELEKKMLRAEKRKFETEKEQISKLKEALFPHNNLQERIDNFAVLYAIYGKEWLQVIYDNSKGLAQEFGVITIG